MLPLVGSERGLQRRGFPPHLITKIFWRQEPFQLNQHPFTLLQQSPEPHMDAAGGQHKEMHLAQLFLPPITYAPG